LDGASGVQIECDNIGTAGGRRLSSSSKTSRKLKEGNNLKTSGDSGNKESAKEEEERKLAKKDGNEAVSKEASAAASKDSAANTPKEGTKENPFADVEAANAPTSAQKAYDAIRKAMRASGTSSRDIRNAFGNLRSLEQEKSGEHHSHSAAFPGGSKASSVSVSANHVAGEMAVAAKIAPGSTSDMDEMRRKINDLTEKRNRRLQKLADERTGRIANSNVGPEVGFIN
jgi:hypothetical protein